MSETARRLALAALICLSGFAVAAPPHAAKAPGSWRPLRVGGGGYLTGLDLSPDGRTKLVRADTYGAYAWDSARRQWRQLVTAQSMPAPERAPLGAAGVYEIRAAPSQSDRLYMAFDDQVFRSDDAGRNWRATSFPKASMNANDPYRMFGQKMAVDPATPDRVLVGTPEAGLWLSEDGGERWRRIVEIPTAAATAEGGHPGISGIGFDPRARDGRTVYASSFGHGVFRSRDGGAIWEALTGGPVNVTHASLGPHGAYWAIGESGASVWRFDGSAWFDATPGGAARTPGVWAAVAADPVNPERVIVAGGDGSLAITADGGKSWRRRGANGRLSRVAKDAPWLAWTEERYMTVGDIALDPTHPDRLWFAEGVGVWQTSVAADFDADPSLAYTSATAGIEQLVAVQVLSPPGGKPLLASWDRPVFRSEDPDRYPSRHGPDNKYSIVMGWSLDYAASDPRYIAGLFNWWGIESSGYSRDGGQSWTPFPAYPPLTSAGKIGGSLAVSDPGNIVWAPSNNGRPYYTRDGGATWLEAEIPGVPVSGDTGWGYAYYLNRRIVAADRVARGEFYLYNSPRGLFRSRDGGATWTLVHAGEIAPWSGANAQLVAAPGWRGRLLFTSGPQGDIRDRHPAEIPLMASKDGGATWAPLPGVKEVYTVGFGKGPGADPAVLIVGWVEGEYGVWRSQDGGLHWTKLGDLPLGILNTISTISGDADNPDRVYVGFRGAGFALWERDAPR